MNLTSTHRRALGGALTVLVLGGGLLGLLRAGSSTDAAARVRPQATGTATLPPRPTYPQPTATSSPTMTALPTSAPTAPPEPTSVTTPPPTPIRVTFVPTVITTPVR